MKPQNPKTPKPLEQISICSHMWIVLINDNDDDEVEITLQATNELDVISRSCAQASLSGFAIASFGRQVHW